ncbi:MAG: aldo/keto reductase [Blautia sp.]|nr:aldo/keto reductase [Blautia sp.]MDY5031091.1 aldo/keto reductase [Blautia sp.]
MEYVTLGKTGLKVSRMGFGGIPIQKCSEKEVTVLMKALAERGVNYIDSARGYTVSESLIGQAIEGIRNRFVLATKSMSRTREAMAADIDISLKNFRTDHIDLYQVHNPSEADLDKVVAPGGALEALLEAKEEGKIRHIGLTAHSVQVFERALEMDWVETIMFPYNIVESQGAELIRKAAEKNVGFIDMKPMAGGAIEDASLALRYICANPDVTIVIPGIYCVEELEQNLAAVEDTTPLCAEELEKIETIRQQLGENFCRRCNYCQPCTAGINISGVFLFAGYLQRYDLGEWGYGRYQALPVKPDACVDCGECESRCPYHLPIREMLKKCESDFKEFEANRR